MALAAPLRRLSDTLAAIKKPGAFFTSGVVADGASPGLSVTGVGAITLPIAQKTAQTLIAKATRAPYGHGEETLVDTRVRNTWELTPAQFTLDNARWQSDVITPLAHECARQMGVTTPNRVDAKLFKLLVYEKGGKFERHQDSEKERGMFGTLVVVLPSTFAGGELVVYPPGRSGASTTDVGEEEGTPQTWRSSYGYATKKTGIKYAAFYADCDHAVEPVTRGYRVCLTYNLVLPQARTKRTQTVDADAQVPELTQALHQYFSTPTISDQNTSYYYVDLDEKKKDRSKFSKPKVFTYVLDHKYTNQSLSMDQLKNKDLAVAQRLARVCDNTQQKPVDERYKLYLCQVQYNLAYDPEYEYEDEDEKERTVLLQGPWRHFGHEGMDASLGSRLVNLHREVAPIGRFTRVKFDGHETNYTGNEGMRRENWYKTAALVVLPLTQEYKMLIDKGPDTFCFQLMVHVTMASTISEEARHFATLAFKGRVYDWINTSQSFKMCLNAVIKLNDVDVFVSLLSSVQVFEYDTERALTDAISHFGWEQCFPKLLVAMEKRAAKLNLRSRMSLVCSLTASQGEGGLGQCSAVDAAQLFENILAIDRTPNPHHLVNAAMADIVAKRLKVPCEVDTVLMTGMLEFAHRVSPDALGKSVMLEGVPLIEVMVPAFVTFATTKQTSGPLDDAITGAATALMERITADLPNPDSWTIGPELEIPYHHCWGCPECTNIQDFYSSESEHELRVRVAGERRDHMTSLIRKHLADVMSWTIDRTGRPHVLVITKKPVNVEKRRLADDALQRLRAVVP